MVGVVASYAGFVPDNSHGSLVVSSVVAVDSIVL